MVLARCVCLIGWLATGAEGGQADQSEGQGSRDAVDVPALDEGEQPQGAQAARQVDGRAAQSGVLSGLCGLFLRNGDAAAHAVTVDDGANTFSLDLPPRSVSSAIWRK